MKYFYYFFLLLICPYLATIKASVPHDAVQIFPIQWSATKEIRACDYSKALEIIKSDTSDFDTALHFFKLGIIHSNLNDQVTALPYFKLAAQQSILLAPVVYVLLGDYALKNSDTKNALSAYLAALDPNCPDSFHRYVYTKLNTLFEKDSAIFKKDSTLLSKDNRLTNYQLWTEATYRKKPSFIINIIDSLLATEAWGALDSILDTATLTGSDLCQQISLISQNKSIQEKLQSNSILTCAQIASICNNYKTAKEFLDTIKNRADSSSKSIDAKATYLRAKIAYNTGQYNEALREYKKFINKYGIDSEVILQIARCYKKKENPTETQKWYDKHIQLFPTHSKTQEILWLKAWQQEDRHKLSNAGKIYKKIYTNFKSGQRRDESYLRHALCYYRQEKFDSSLVILSSFLKKFPSSNLFPAALFWKGKVLLATDKNSEAKIIFNQVINYDPFDYYAYRSRYYLPILGDSSLFSIDSITDFKNAYKWIDSISPVNRRKSFSHIDSLNYKRGMICISLGLIDIAESFLNSTETISSQDLALQFELALLYSICDAPAQAFRIAKKLTWRIPPQIRKSTPLAVHMLLYPAFFTKTIHSEADIQSIDPNLVSAVIRQESIFDPKIVSPVGAIGLMQIMPYTGKDLANELKIPFDTDSLYNPLYNIKLGSYYIQDLLKNFNGNTVLVLSSYNAGPHNARKWFEKNKKKEFDLFVEDIEFTETRGYVKKVMGNYWTYQELSRYPAFLDYYTPRLAEY